MTSLINSDIAKNRTTIATVPRSHPGCQSTVIFLQTFFGVIIYRAILFLLVFFFFTCWFNPKHIVVHYVLLHYSHFQPSHG